MTALHAGNSSSKRGNANRRRVLDDEQRVRVDRVRVEQVVLHAADDAAERRDVQPENAVRVHSLQRPRDALRRAQDVEEQPVVARVLAKLLVDEPEVLLHERDRARVDAAQVEVLLEQQEHLEQRRRLAREHLVVGHLEIAVAALEARAERERRLVSCRAGSPPRRAAAASR